MNVVEELAVKGGRSMVQSSVTSVVETFPEFDDLVISPKSSWYSPLKTAVDFLVALTLLIALAPVILLFAVLVRVTSKGPAFYCQRRLGRDGREFVMVKLRTMVHNAESGTGAVWATTADPRVTRLGAFMRKTQIDEFPQLVNVILGQMSLIGPRPERPEIADNLELDIPNYRQRLRVKPGITGLAQLSLPADTDIESVRKKLIPDLYYVRNMGPWLDMRIFVFTITYFVKSMSRQMWANISLPSLHVAQQTLRDEFYAELDRDARN